ncbi:hypothetical protein [Salarchaeum sp. JOR-1]|uniref:hypothetical protein n=1 Tax=Salarchaeum sp. JOR-1 TaxID=2599399 RepID=UPI00143DB16E|nr:hypothetical protein [Salarchaeum sp. JOR-1]
MGLKSGSRDAGLDDEEVDEDVADGQSESEAVEQPETENESAASRTADTVGSESEADDRPSMSSIPYKLRRDKVNEGREQVPYFLREEVVAGEDDLQAELEDVLDEKVYKSDYREAAMVVAQRNPDLIADVLREWGYDLE